MCPCVCARVGVHEVRACVGVRGGVSGTTARTWTKTRTRTRTRQRAGGCLIRWDNLYEAGETNGNYG